MYVLSATDCQARTSSVPLLLYTLVWLSSTVVVREMLLQTAFVGITGRSSGAWLEVLEQLLHLLHWWPEEVQVHRRPYA
jgi:hypothetical protein